jgi:multiple sugar transport system substrate-binding protein
MVKRMIIFLLALLMFGIPSFAGGGKEDGTGSTQSNTQVKNITLWFYMEGQHQQAVLNEQIQEFNNSQSSIVVKSRYIPFADFKKQLSIGVTASELPDMVIIDGPDHASYAAMGIFADITGKIDTTQYYDGPIASCTFNDKLYGIPLGSNCLALYYNKDMLSAANRSVPTTWEELRATAKVLTSGKVSGIAFCSLQNEEGTFNFMPWLWSTGTTSFQINNPQGVKALTYVGDLVKDGSMPREAINWTQGDVKNQFVSGNLAMMINGPWQVPPIRSDAPNLKWDVTLIPRDAKFSSVLGGENWAIINNANVAASLEFIKYMTIPNTVKRTVDPFGYIAARKDVAAEQFAGDAIMQKFTEELQYAQPRGPHARWPEISDAISLAFNEVITQRSTPAQAAAKAQTTIDGIVK